MTCIERGLWPATRLLGIISKNTKGSWWVPFEFGVARHKQVPISLLLLEDVDELPSYLKLPTVEVIKDSIDLFNSVEKISVPSTFHLRFKGGTPDVPRLAPVRGAAPKYR